MFSRCARGLYHMMENEGDDVNCRFSKRALSLVGHFLSPICALRARPVSSDGKTGGGTIWRKVQIFEEEN